MKKLLSFLYLLVLVVCSFSAQQGGEPMAPLFRDPITDGAADPCVIYNPFEESWWMLYTQRRANVETADVAYCYGNKIGVAYSTDHGVTWRYRGTLDLEFDRGTNTFWAPEVVCFEGVYHMFVSYIEGVSNHWSGQARMAHYVSINLWDWEFKGFIALEGDVIDATLHQLANGTWRMWYKYKNVTYYADSKDLYTWVPYGTPAVSDQNHEGANVFQFRDSYWMITDQWAGMGVYRSNDLEKWYKQDQLLLDEGSQRKDDYPSGAHGDVVVIDGQAYIFYFTHPGRRFHTKDYHDKNGNIPYEMRRSSIQVAELDVINNCLVVKDRNKPISIYLPHIK